MGFAVPLEDIAQTQHYIVTYACYRKEFYFFLNSLVSACKGNSPRHPRVAKLVGGGLWLLGMKVEGREEFVEKKAELAYSKKFF